jgi:hypothetical protein
MENNYCSTARLMSWVMLEWMTTERASRCNRLMLLWPQFGDQPRGV